MKTIDRPLTPEEQDERYLHLIPDIEAEFEAGYDETLLEYHIWQHANNVYEANSRHRQELIALGYRNIPGRFMTFVDSKGHDFRYKKYFDLQKNGDNPYSSAEELSGVEAGHILTSKGIDKFTVAEFAHNVMGTKLGVRCNTMGRLTLCAADLQNTGEDYENTMKPDTEKLRIEKSRLDETLIDPTKFAVGALVVLTRYHFENLFVPRLLSKSPRIREFYFKQGANLRRMAFEQAALAGQVGEDAVNSFLHNLGEQIVKICHSENENQS